MTPTEFEELLTDISNCFIACDFSLSERRISLPFTIVTQAGPTTMTNRDCLRANFGLYLSACKTMNLDTIFRTPVSLEDCHDGTFMGTYTTELLSKGTRRTDPFTSSALMRREGDTWRIISILNARGHHGWTGHQPHQ